MSIIHPDKCSAPEAVEIAKAVNVAYKVLTNQETRNYYNLCGKISMWEDYDNGQAEKDAKILKKLLKKQSQKKQYQATTDENEEFEQASEPEDSWTCFLKRCAEKAKQQSSATVHETTNQQDQEQDNNNTSDSDLRNTKASNPPVYTLDSETEDEQPENNENRPPTPKFADTASSPVKFDNEKTFKDASTSPIKFENEKTTRSAATSPVKFEDEKATADASTSPVKFENNESTSSPLTESSSTSKNTPSSSAKQNLNFDTSATDPATNNSPGHNSKTSAPPNPNTSTSSNAHDSNRRTSIHKQYIMQVHGYRMRYLPDGTGVCRFSVRWGPGGHDLIEPADIVFKEKTGLRNWLDWLQVNKPKKYDAIVRYHPEFLQVYD